MKDAKVINYKKYQIIIIYNYTYTYTLIQISDECVANAVSKLVPYCNVQA